MLRASSILDGRGTTLTDRDIVVRDGRIEAIVSAGQGAGAVIYRLEGLTLLPGLIDTHVHIGWHFDRSGKTPSNAVQETPEESILYSAENAFLTLMSGVTTVQSLGAPSDAELRTAIERGILPGPRILTSLRPLDGRSGNADEIRGHVQALAAQGADVIKIYDAVIDRSGAVVTMTQEQLDAACGEARAQGLRTAVHAHVPETAARSVRAGCTSIEHGSQLDMETLELMAEHGTFYAPNIDLLYRNYFENKDRFLGVGSYTDARFEQMRMVVPLALRAFQEALTVPGLRIVFGTDAVAGAHGRNYEELVYRSEVGGQTAMDAVVSATSLAAESLGMEDEIGSIAPGMAADIIGTDGNPSADIQALGRVLFVMKGGKVYLNESLR